jgi:hypothetical protein
MTIWFWVLVLMVAAPIAAILFFGWLLMETDAERRDWKRRVLTKARLRK